MNDVDTMNEIVMEDIQVREASPDDAVMLALLGRFTFAETFEQYFTDKEGLHRHYETTYSVSKMKSSLQKPNNVFWIAEYRNLPVGYVKLRKHAPSKFMLPGKSSQLQKIYVLKDFISHGVGGLLLDALFAKVKAIGSDYLWLSVWEKNGRGIRFYQKNCFEVTGHQVEAIGKDEFRFLILKKELRQDQCRLN